ncbi:hypothetical protein Gotri_005908 [Gossypium trilobum]|uniref:Uncharacterized protein n=1 Tax=Gossypium trilobum TaxID=34281 RepID=A0A7J9EY34_9ROSI|nr:hypothetical protein [Gossypium trilobum]
MLRRVQQLNLYHKGQEDWSYFLNAGSDG